jgi:hypothetical protein
LVPWPEASTATRAFTLARYEPAVTSVKQFHRARAGTHHRASSALSQCDRLASAACLTSRKGLASVRRVHWKVPVAVCFRPTVEPEGGRSEVPIRGRKQEEASDDPPYLPDPGSIEVLLRPVRSPATQTRQVSVPTPFPAVRATTPTSAGVESICCTGNFVRELGGSRDTQHGAPLLPWSCEKEADPVGSDRLGVLRTECARGEL